ncbi:hypothetical protein OIO90_000715 [Microbotryomycetes sp. JL221]|nr:hypothetical protein OIO90_000715 [Microbotryomycetes sp. JL221]
MSAEEATATAAVEDATNDNNKRPAETEAVDASDSKKQKADEDTVEQAQEPTEATDDSKKEDDKEASNESAPAAEEKERESPPPKPSSSKGRKSDDAKEDADMQVGEKKRELSPADNTTTVDPMMTADMNYLDTSNIIEGRRTRGKKIDYSKIEAANDDLEDDEDDEDANPAPPQDDEGDDDEDAEEEESGFALKKYIKEHWSPFFTSFKGPAATSAEVKQQVRKLVFEGLSDPVRKMRLACAAVTSEIAHPDWPDEWPTLMSELLQLISSNSADSVDGGMRVLLDFVGIDLTEDQLLPIAKDLLPQLLRILGMPDTHAPSTRARAVQVFKQCVMTLFTVKDEYPAAVKAAVSEILPQWLNAFRQLLDVDVKAELSSTSWEALAVRRAIYESLEVVLHSFPSAIKISLGTFSLLALKNLNDSIEVYRAAYLSSASEFDIPSEQEEDSQVAADLPSVVAGALDFLSQAVRRKGNGNLRDDPDVVMAITRLVFTYAQMSTEDEDSWASDPNAFIADEDDEMLSFTPRAASLELANAVVEMIGTPAWSILWRAFQKRAHESDEARTRGEEDWWKGYEAALAVAGAVSVDLLEHVEDATARGTAPAFDLGMVFASTVPTYLNETNLPFLQGRSFVFASQFSSALPNDLTNQYIDAANNVLGSDDAGVPVKISAVRALNNFFRHIKNGVDASRSGQALSHLFPLLPRATDNTLVLVVETIESGVKAAGSALDEHTTSGLARTLFEIWFSKPEDPMLAATIGSVLTTIASLATPAINASLTSTILPEINLALARVKIDPYGTAVSSAIEFLDAIFIGLPAPLPRGTLTAVAGPLFDVLTATDDRQVVQSGLNVVTNVVRKDVNQLLDWRDDSGRSGLDLVLSIVAKQLDPSQEESGGLFVGDLVIHLIRKAGSSLGPVLPELLKAFVTRLATAQTSSFSQSLILPFAYLAREQLDTVLSLLETMTVEGRPGLEILLNKWADAANVFQGFWNIKVSTVAMSRLFESARPNLAHINVKGDMLLTSANSNTIMTRSRARQNPDQFESIPFPAKALKLLVNDAQNAAADKSAHKDSANDDAASDDGDDEWADEGDEFASGLNDDLALLSDLLGSGGSLAKYLKDNDSEAGDDQDAFDAEDLQDDPVYNLDMKDYLFSFLKRSYENDVNSFRHYAEQYLNQQEKDALAAILRSA